jgi:FMN reductase
MSLSEGCLIVGIGGTTRANSSSELAVRFALAAARELGAETRLICGSDLVLPLYAPENAARTESATQLVDALRRADGVIVASPGYHGSLSGLIKNALDYTEDMRVDEHPYFEGRAVGLIACAAGPQAAGSTLAALRSIAHALRGWPSPLGVTINTAGPVFGERGDCLDAVVGGQLRTLASEVVTFAKMRQVYLRESCAVQAA